MVDCFSIFVQALVFEKSVNIFTFYTLLSWIEMWVWKFSDNLRVVLLAVSPLFNKFIHNLDIYPKIVRGLTQCHLLQYFFQNSSNKKLHKIMKCPISYEWFPQKITVCKI